MYYLQTKASFDADQYYRWYNKADINLGITCRRDKK